MSNPIPQKSIVTTHKNVQIGIGSTVPDEENYEVFNIEQTFKLDIIRNLAESNGFKSKIANENIYYLWVRGKDLIGYDIVANKLSILGTNILILEQIDDNIFSNIAKKYFNEEWQYENFSKVEKNGETEYLAYRKISNGAHVESRENKNETDKIVVENGEITTAILTLSNFRGTGEYVPLVNRNDLNRYINQQEYPKEILPSYDTLNSVMGMEYFQSYEEISKTLNNCIADKITVVYYYKNVNQSMLTPVYKAIGGCDVVYEKNTYQIPAVIYINAIDPNYILKDGNK